MFVEVADNEMVWSIINVVFIIVFHEFESYPFLFCFNYGKEVIV